MVSLAGLLLSEGNLETQLTLVALWAVLWYFIIKYSAKYIFEPFIASKPWRDQWTDLSDKTFQTALMVKFKTKQEVFEFGCLFLAILCQHGVGGLLCVPSLLGGSGSVVAAMACHGGLCEAGWELQDAITRIYQLLFGGESGKAKNPPPLCVILFLHHAMGLGMVIPMNIMYHENSYYHEFVFLLQGAAFVACLSQNYGFTLNVKTAAGLTQMKTCVSITFVTMVYSRAVRYAMVGYKLMVTFYADGNTKMLCMGGFVLSLMGLLNVLFVGDAIGKFMKFMKMHHEDGELEGAIVRMHSSIQRHNSAHIMTMTKSRKEWSKIRGAVHMGAFHKSKSEGKAQ